MTVIFSEWVQDVIMSLGKLSQNPSEKFLLVLFQI